MIADVDELKPEAQYTVFHPSEVELADTTSAVLAEVERLQPVRIVFDSLSELRMLARDSALSPPSHGFKAVLCRAELHRAASG